MKLKKIIASAMAAVLLVAAVSVNANADVSGKTAVNGYEFSYSSTLTDQKSTLYGSAVGDPLLHYYKVKISADYVYKNSSTGISTAKFEYTDWRKTNNSLTFVAPSGNKMKSVSATFWFDVDGATDYLKVVDSI